MKRAVLIIVVLAIVGAGAYFFWIRKPAPATEMRLSGNIEAHESLVGFKVPGRIVELPVQEGQALQVGDLIAKLDAADYRQQVAIDEAATHVRRSQLELALAGSRPQDIKAAHQAVLDAQADLEQKKKDFARYDSLYKLDEVTGQVRDQAETNVERAKAVYERQQQIYNELLEGTRKEQITVDRANLHQAKQNLGMSRIRLGYTSLEAPFSGVILVRQAELGEVASAGSPVITLADLDHIWLRVYLPETQLARVKLGQSVNVRSDTFPDKNYTGRVSFISPEAEFTPKSVQTDQERVTLVYRMKVDVENPNHELKPGMPADVYIPLH
ncbi:MAG: HlyD family secretion protein [Acidobacteriaceae bacterium]